MARKNYYEILGLTFNATYEEIRAAYRKLAFDLHPDRNPTAEAAAEFQDVMQAYTVLINADSRAEYDAQTLSYVELTGGVNQAGIDLSALYPDQSNVQETAAAEFAKYLKKHKRRKALLQTIFAVFVIFLIASYGLKPVSVSPTTSISQQSTDTSTSSSGTTSGTSGSVNKPGLNQRLIIVQGLQGPIGLPGPAGPSGRDGRDGSAGAVGVAGAAGEMGPIGPAGPAGEDGVIGIDGVPGIDGIAGAGVVISSFTGAQGSCTDGGTKFSVPGQADTYACNGTGGSGGGGGSLGAGYADIGACDASVQISFRTEYDTGSNELKLSAIVIDKLSGACDDKTLRAIIKIKSSKDSTENYYNSGDSYECSAVLDLDGASGVDANSVALTSDDCTNTRTNAATFNSIWVTDVDGSARAFLLQIS
jgi:hypothetical protein